VRGNFYRLIAIPEIGQKALQSADQILYKLFGSIGKELNAIIAYFK